MVIKKIKQILGDKETYKLGFLVGIVAYLLSWVIGVLKIPVLKFGIPATDLTVEASTISIRQQIIERGVATGLGNALLEWLAGIQVMNIMAILATIIGAMIIVIIGRIVYNYLPQGKPTWKLALVLLYGALIGSIIFMFVGIPPITAIISIAIYWVLVAIIINLVTRLKMFSRMKVNV